MGHVDNSKAKPFLVYGNKPKGFMRILPNCYISMPEKPLAFHLLMMKLLLGWKWIDADEKGCLKL